MSQYDLKVVGKMKKNEYETLKSYIDILCDDDKLTVIIADSIGNFVSEFSEILEQNDLIKVSEDTLIDDTYKMTYKRKK